MIRAFLDSWPLFGHTWMVGWLVALLLSTVGVFVVARNQIFVGAAVSQAATLGVATAMASGALIHARSYEWLHSDDCLMLFAIGFGMAAAAVTARGGPLARPHHESTTGWVYLTGASLAVLVLSHSPHGTEEIHRLLASSILGASPRDLVLFGALAAVSAACLWVLRLRIVLFCLDPLAAAAAGVPRWFGPLLLLWLGLAVGLSIRTAGTLYTFGCLVLPALAARNLCRNLRALVVVTPLVALACTVAGFIVANSTDDPPAPMAVAFLCAAVLGSAGLRRLAPAAR